MGAAENGSRGGSGLGVLCGHLVRGEQDNGFDVLFLDQGWARELAPFVSATLPSSAAPKAAGRLPRKSGGETQNGGDKWSRLLMADVPEAPWKGQFALLPLRVVTKPERQPQPGVTSTSALP